MTKYLVIAVSLIFTSDSSYHLMIKAPLVQGGAFFVLSRIGLFGEKHTYDFC